MSPNQLLPSLDSATIAWHVFKHTGAEAFMAQGGSVRGL